MTLAANLLDSSSVKSSLGDPNTDIRYGRLALVAGTMVTGMTAIHIYQQNGWWANNRAPFHVQEDLTYGLWVDKIGHFYGASLLGLVVQKSVEWANVREENALVLGAGAGALFQTFIEIEDGFSAWGFDRVDFAFDLAGAGWNIARYHFPSLQNFDLKLSYLPSPLINSSEGIGFRGQKHLMMDDYEGQTFWLSCKINNLLPPTLEPYWPDFLCVALGYGARDISSPKPYPVVYLALDYDMEKIIPSETWFLRALGQGLNFIHFPAPTIRISPSAIWYGLFF